MKLVQLNLDKVFKNALKHGGEFAELFYESTDSKRIFFENKKIDKINSGIDAGIGLRIIYGNQSVYGYTTELNEKSLLTLAEILSKVVQGKIANNQSFALNSLKNNFSNPILKDPRSSDYSSKINFLERASQVAWGTDPRITQVTVAYVETFRSIEIVNSFGDHSTDQKQYLTFYTNVVGSSNGQSQSSYEAEGGYIGLELLDKISPEQIAMKAANRLQVLLSAKPAPSGSMPVVLSAEAGGTMIHEAVGHGLEADLACNGLSVYKNKIGQQVASKLVSIVDDGTMVGRRGSYAFDDEGTPSKKNLLIENGILKAYMADRLSHIKFGSPMTGNGRRESYRHKPIVRMTNTYLSSGKDDPSEILSSTPKGLFVKSMGGGQVNTVTGDFVFAVTEGYLIRNGQIAEPVRGATLTGNGPSVLMSLDKIGNDLGFAIGTCGKDGQGAPVTDAQPTIRIPEIVVGGEVGMSNYW